ncbi:hypothetical protein RMATCC62417_17834 [Rhizopus microsporus]|nr:hypothetical protein RMATCC62417_17834 [Rhizopus microsporus]
MIQSAAKQREQVGSVNVDQDEYETNSLSVPENETTGSGAKRDNTMAEMVAYNNKKKKQKVCEDIHDEMESFRDVMQYGNQDYLQDNLVDYLDQLKKLSLNHTLTPLELSYQTRSETEEEPSLTYLIGKRKKSPDSSPRKRQATDQDIDALLESVVVEDPVQEHDALVDKGDDANDQTKDEANNSDTQWQCPDCQFDNPIYVQTCGVCRKSKTIPVIQSTRAHTVPKAASVNKDLEAQSYMPTVAVDNEPESATIAPDKVQSTENNKRKEVHVMYTGLSSEDEETLSKLVNSKRDTKLKIFIHFKMRDFHDVTHIITSVDNKRLCKRTFKYLQGVLEGKWIVTPACKFRWCCIDVSKKYILGLIESIHADRWLPEDTYEVKGDHVTGITQAPIKGRERIQQDVRATLCLLFVKLMY